MDEREQAFVGRLSTKIVVAAMFYEVDSEAWDGRQSSDQSQ